MRPTLTVDPGQSVVRHLIYQDSTAITSALAHGESPPSPPWQVWQVCETTRAWLVGRSFPHHCACGAYRLVEAIGQATVVPGMIEFQHRSCTTVPDGDGTWPERCACGEYALVMPPPPDDDDLLTQAKAALARYRAARGPHAPSSPPPTAPSARLRRRIVLDA